MVEITDEDSARAWLEGKPREVQVAFAARCALRALPGIATDTPETLSGLALPIQRAILTSAVAAVGSTADVKEAADSAAHSAYSAANSAARSAYSAAFSAFSAAHSAVSAHSAADSAAAHSAVSADSAAAHSAVSADSAAHSAAAFSAAHSAAAFSAAHSAVSADSAADSAAAFSAAHSAVSADSAAHSAAAFSAISADAGVLDGLADVSEVFLVDLWHGTGLPQGFAEALKTLYTFWLAEPEVWGFWQRWYEGMLRGKPMAWELQRRVALVPDVDWEKGAAHVPGLIAEIEADHVGDLVPLAETIEYLPEIGLFDRRTVPIEGGATFAATLESVRDDLDEALRGNALTPNTYVARVLDRTLTRYGNNPERVEMDLMKCGKSLQSQMGKGDLPDTPEVEGLADTCIQGALDIRAHHPEIAEARAKRAIQAQREATPEEKEVLSEAIPAVQSITTESLGKEITEDLTEVIEGTAVGMSGDAALSTDEVARSANRLARLWLLSKKVAKGGAYVAGGTAALAGGLVAIDQAIPVLQKAWPVLMRLLGM